jgi:hypothetical protein
MKLIGLTATVSMLAAVLAAQEPSTYLFTSSPVMGRTVKGAPYSADEITESQQTLSDGTNITRQSKTTVYRDGEGRVRRETPKEITIFDPVASVSYTLNPKTMTAVKRSLGMVAEEGQKILTFTTSSSTSSASIESKAELDAAVAGAIAAKMKAELAAQLEQVQAKMSATKESSTEKLGQQVMEGLTVDGARTTNTIEAGAIGNDRPIHVVNERWYSDELKLTVMTKHTDPRTGEETFRLANVHRGEPGAYLFMVPAEYQIVSRGETKKEE